MRKIAIVGCGLVGTSWGLVFARAGYDLPKPFIDVAGRPMIDRVIDNLALPGARFVVIARRETLEHPAAERLVGRTYRPGLHSAVPDSGWRLLLHFPTGAG